MTAVRRTQARRCRRFIPQDSKKAISKTQRSLREHNGPQKPGRAIAPQASDVPNASAPRDLEFAHQHSPDSIPRDVFGRQSDRKYPTRMEHDLQSDALDVGTHAQCAPVTTRNVGVRGRTMPLLSTPGHPSKVGGVHPKPQYGVGLLAGWTPVHPTPLTRRVHTSGVRGVVRTVQVPRNNRRAVSPSSAVQSASKAVHPGVDTPAVIGCPGVSRGGHLGGVSL